MNDVAVAGGDNNDVDIGPALLFDTIDIINVVKATKGVITNDTSLKTSQKVRI